MSAEMYRLLERLAGTVVRAFYDDELVMVMDMLIRHRQIRDADLGVVTGLAPKQVRKAVQRLQAEKLCDFEKASDDAQGRASVYWFVNYRRLVLAVTWRCHRAQQVLEARERKEQERQTYVCEACALQFTLLEVQRLANGGRGFCCSHCCPYDTHAGCGRDGRPTSFPLKEVAAGDGAERARRALRRLRRQLSAAPGGGAWRPDGVLDLLKALRDLQARERLALPTNLPSENFRRGVGVGRGAGAAAAAVQGRNSVIRAGLVGAAAAALGHNPGAAAAAEEAAAGPMGRRGGRRAAAGPGPGDPLPLNFGRTATGATFEVELREEGGDGGGWARAGEEEGGGGGGGGGFGARLAQERKRAREDAKDYSARRAQRKRKALPTFLGRSRISGADGGEEEEGGGEGEEGGSGSDGGEDDGGSEEDTEANGDQEETGTSFTAEKGSTEVINNTRGGAIERLEIEVTINWIPGDEGWGDAEHEEEGDWDPDAEVAVGGMSKRLGDLTLGDVAKRMTATEFAAFYWRWGTDRALPAPAEA